MKKTYKYRIYPTKKQTRKLSQWLAECRWLYNYFLEERKKSWEEEKKGIPPIPVRIVVDAVRGKRCL